MLNADGTLWQEKLGGQMEIIGEMSAARADGIIPECRSASLRNRRSASPESPQLRPQLTKCTGFAGGSENVLLAISERFHVVRRRAHRRWLLRASIFVAGFGLLAWGLHSGVSTVMRGFEREALISRIEYAQEVLRSDALDQTALRFGGDESLRSRLLTIADDRERPMHTRLNAPCVQDRTPLTQWMALVSHLWRES